MPLAEWPALDRGAWAAVVEDAGMLDDPGLAAHWRPETRRSVIRAYGRYLTFLDRNDWLDREAGPPARLTPDRLRAYVAELSDQVAPVTLSGRITGLAEALRVMAPGTTYPYLNLARRRLKARARPSRKKQLRLVSTESLISLGFNLMARAETEAFPRELWQACTYRDGLIIVILALRPIRRSNLAAMRLGVNLIGAGDAYRLAFGPESTKNHRSYARLLDPRLTPYIQRYLTHYRPLLLGAWESDHVWISWRSKPMVECSLYGNIMRHTKAAFGCALSPHLFRDAAMTSLAEQNPEHVWLGMSLLHHADPRIAERHYNQALDATAVGRYQSVIRNDRRTILKADRDRQKGAARRDGR